MVSDLIVVAERRAYAPSCTFQLMSRLLLDRQVLWVDADAFRRERHAQAAPAAASPPTANTAPDVKAPFPVLTAEDLGAGAHPLAPLVSSRLLARRVMRTAQSHRLRNPILWLASPWAAPLLEAGYDGPVVYQVGPEQLPADADAARACAVQEAAILARADLVLLPARDALPQVPRARTRLLPAAVDLDLFSTPAQRARDLPQHRPIAGCHGHFDRGFDARLFADIARRLPHWRFMLLGPVACDLSAVRGLANVRVAGARSQDQLPRYLQFWNASLLLRHPGAPVRRAPPVTLLEALATGLPVLVAGRSNLGGYADLVTRAEDADAAAAAVSAAAAEPAEWRALRRRRVAGDGWDARAAMVNRLLADLDAHAAIGAIAGR
ncbi:MAG: glycosyltransferase [Thiohalocapsa sp.]|jgi:glycosyltransferase involved in cell wall biosynthesis|uniref:glycosyltransferase family protein n=1 Tax=Thiohalocapsa sp. TaxID=2497641 RepID=UPI0025F6742B|nr:glycosyltransferase [Thiohalocapsa sp.]MCG6943623.1 glycosyltransferase [Thiohalocapsa sp.]